MSLQRQINDLCHKTVDEENPKSHSCRIDKLERWQIKVALIIGGGAVIITALAIWFVNWSMNRIIEQVIGG